MIKPMYAIRDRKTTFMPPFIEMTDDAAIRGFEFAVSHGTDGLMNFSPDDFSLYKVGDFNSADGTVIPTNPPRFICNAGSYNTSAE